VSREQKFFKRISSRYQDLVSKRDSTEELRMIVEPRMGEKVLDVGNGGVRDFNSPQTSLYVGVDFSLEMLKKGKSEGIRNVCAEALKLAFREGSFDTLFYRSLLHHLAGRNVRETIQTVKTALNQGFSCLKTEGNVLIIEPCLPSFLEGVEELLYYLCRAFFFLTKQSSVFLFSAGTLTRVLLESGFREIEVWKIDDHSRSRWELISPMIGLSFIKIPRGLNPTKRTIFEARK